MTNRWPYTVVPKVFWRDGPQQKFEKKFLHLTSAMMQQQAEKNLGYLIGAVDRRLDFGREELYDAWQEKLKTEKWWEAYRKEREEALKKLPLRQLIREGYLEPLGPLQVIYYRLKKNKKQNLEPTIALQLPKAQRTKRIYIVRDRPVYTPVLVSLPQSGYTPSLPMLTLPCKATIQAGAGLAEAYLQHLKICEICKNSIKQGG